MILLAIAVSIPNRDLGWFQLLAPETLTVFSFQGAFPTLTSNHRSPGTKKQVEIAETLALYGPTHPRESKTL